MCQANHIISLTCGRSYLLTTDPQNRGKRATWIRIATYTAVALLLGLLVTVIGGYFYNWEWTGYSEYTILKGTQHIGENTVKEDRAEDIQRAKTLWDWLALLFVPGALAGIGILYNRAAERHRHEEADQASKIEDDRQQAATLQTYLDEIGKLLLEKGLLDSKPGDEARVLARVRTLTALEKLDDARKGRLITFLYESGLISKRTEPDAEQAPQGPIIRLESASLEETYLKGFDLKGVVLDGVYLTKANLEGAILSDASLVDAILVKAELSKAKLESADLTRADLSGANLQGAKLREAKLNNALLLKNPKVTEDDEVRDTNLLGADLTQEQLEQAIGEGTTKLPEGRHPPASWPQGEDRQTDGEE